MAKTVAGVRGGRPFASRKGKMGHAGSCVSRVGRPPAVCIERTIHTYRSGENLTVREMVVGRVVG